MQEVTTINELAIIVQNHIANEQERHDVFDEKLDKIDAKATYTNGKVRFHEKMLATLVGGLSVITALVIPLVIYIWSNR